MLSSPICFHYLNTHVDVMASPVACLVNTFCQFILCHSPMSPRPTSGPYPHVPHVPRPTPSASAGRTGPNGHLQIISLYLSYFYPGNKDTFRSLQAGQGCTPLRMLSAGRNRDANIATGLSLITWSKMRPLLIYFIDYQIDQWEQVFQWKRNQKLNQLQFSFYKLNIDYHRTD